MDKIDKTNEDWKKELDPETYHVTREGGTEAPFTGKYWDTHEKGMYKCSNCGLDLFSSDTKFESGTGWPSFTEPMNPERDREGSQRASVSYGMNRENIELIPDDSASMHRVEVRCKRCGAHLGHVFDDGPKEKGGKRFCINSCSLDLEKK